MSILVDDPREKVEGKAMKKDLFFFSFNAKNWKQKINKFSERGYKGKGKIERNRPKVVAEGRLGWRGMSSDLFFGSCICFDSNDNFFAAGF